MSFDEDPNLDPNPYLPISGWQEMSQDSAPDIKVERLSVIQQALWMDLQADGRKGCTKRGLGVRRFPVPSLVYISSALPAFGKQSIRYLENRKVVCLDYFCTWNLTTPFEGNRPALSTGRITWEKPSIWPNSNFRERKER